MDVQQVMTDYQTTYLALYRRNPSELSDLGNDWVLVNGARMTSKELAILTTQLKRELDQQTAKRSVVQRLMKWFSTANA
ncbi:MAG: hypothetical protein BroJett018_08300 [Chloroflexota bacterium]|nr:hypothetical protein [Chloroflexota bacterium]NOG62756.1 hypothetical protein [Chloroflexota bacterium]GIK63036.1 MAG: hypothetical protein BroJett018_08300 [Chloroflexota bacterium]